jgi:hypothetical protein
MRSERERKIIEAALSGLFEFYPCLSDSTLAGEIEASVRVPDTGNDQADYETSDGWQLCSGP